MMGHLDDQGIFVGVTPQCIGMKDFQPNGGRERNDLSPTDHAVRTPLDFAEDRLDLRLHRFGEKREEDHSFPLLPSGNGEELIEDWAEPSCMVFMKVGDQECVEPFDPHLFESGGDVMSLLRRASIDQNGSPLRQTQHDGLPISDIKEADF
jgi:hypothetical protein